MAMSRYSNSSPLALRKDYDSVENEKDFAELKDLAGEEDSDPKVENEKDFARPIKKSKVDEDLNPDDSNPKVTSLTNRDIFELWCNSYGITYAEEKEKEYRCTIFEKALSPPPEMDEHSIVNIPDFADRTPEELDKIFNFTCLHFYNYVFESEIKSMPEVADMRKKLTERGVIEPPSPRRGNTLMGVNFDVCVPEYYDSDD